jgi:hypothetical protein
MIDFTEAELRSFAPKMTEFGSCPPFDRLCESTFNRPAPIKAIPQGALEDAKMPAPFVHVHGFAEGSQ